LPVAFSTLTKLLRAASLVVFSCVSAVAAPGCPAERDEPLVTAHRDLCAKLEEFLRNYCHRNEAAGWKSDKFMRDTGPFIGIFHNGKWTGEHHGTHAPAVVWYSPDMVEWLKKNRAEDGTRNSTPTPVPDGAIMVKEMFPPPTSHCKEWSWPISFLKDNRLLPQGFLATDDRTEIATALGAKADLGEDVAPVGVAGDADLAQGGGDTVLYRIRLNDMDGEPAEIRATLYYQAIPPFFLQDRFCTTKGNDT
jgi:hypothetical protein